MRRGRAGGRSAVGDGSVVLAFGGTTASGGTSQTETDWLAAGIGLIKVQKTADSFLPGGVTAELIDTNLGLQ